MIILKLLFRFRDSFRLGRGAANRFENGSRLRLSDALWGLSDGSNDDNDDGDDDDDDEDEEGEGDEDDAVEASSSNLNRTLMNSGVEGYPNRGIKRKNNRISIRPRDSLNGNQLLGTSPPTSTSASHDVSKYFHD